MISDVPKTLVYELAREINREEEKIPEATLKKEPSAELRPNQKDTRLSAPYDELDPLIEALVDLSLPVDLAARRAGVSRSSRARSRGASTATSTSAGRCLPGPKVTAKAFGEGRRYPIAHRFLV